MIQPTHLLVVVITVHYLIKVANKYIFLKNLLTKNVFIKKNIVETKILKIKF